MSFIKRKKLVSLIVFILSCSTSYALTATNYPTNASPSENGKHVYGMVCATCHELGLAGAPALSNKSYWQTKREQGFDILYSHVLDGYKGMPTMGGCVSCSKQDIADAINYMLGTQASTNAYPTTDVDNAPIEQQQSTSTGSDNTTNPPLQNPSFQQLMKIGEQTYHRYCSSCHKQHGQGEILGAPALTTGLIYSSYITIDKPISRNIDIILQGVPNTAMIGFGSILSDIQIAGVITYIRNAWHNKTNDVVLPEDIAKEKSILVNKPQNIDNKDYNYAELMQLGKTNYRAYCARCHQLNGLGKAPHGPKLNGSYVAAHPELINYKIALVLHGVPGTRMRGYSQQLTNLELASILTYITNAWDNQGHQTIQPKDIQAIRTQLQNTEAKDTTSIKYSYQQLMKLGQYEYLGACARCHLPDGKGGAQEGVPTLIASTITIGQPYTKHIDLVLTGIPGSIMRSFAPRLNNLQIAAIITYERNAWGNNTGDIIQPEDINRERQRLQKQIDYQTQYQLQQQYLQDEKKGNNNPAQPSAAY